MYEFLVIAGAIFAAQIALVCVGAIAITNKRMIKWYAKKTAEMTKELNQEIKQLVDEEDWEL